MAAVITSITGLQNLPNLTNFNADFNGLQSVNLSGLTSLIYADISDNNIANGAVTNAKLAEPNAFEDYFLLGSF